MPARELASRRVAQGLIGLCLVGAGLAGGQAVAQTQSQSAPVPNVDQGPGIDVPPGDSQIPQGSVAPLGPQGPRGPMPPGVNGVAGSVAEAEASAAEPPRRAYHVQASVGALETYSNNLQLSSTNRQSGGISSLNGNLSLIADGKHLNGFLVYDPSAMFYSSGGGNQWLNALSSQGTYEAFDQRFFLDEAASVTHQSISAFSTQSAVLGTTNSNLTEVATLRVTPRVVTRVGSDMVFNAQVTEGVTRSKGTSLGDQNYTNYTVSLADSHKDAKAGWSVNYAEDRTEYTRNSGATQQAERLYAALMFRPDPDVSLAARAGKERDNYLTVNPETSNTYGFDANWTPSPRTQVTSSWDSHEYGNSYELKAQYRMQRSIFSLSDSRAVNVNGTTQTSLQQTYFSLFYALYANSVPDPAQRTNFVNTLLASMGLNPNAPAVGGFLAGGLTMSHQVTAAYTLQGKRDTFTGMVFSNTTSTLAPAGIESGDLSVSSFVRQRGVNLNLTHQMSAQTSAVINALYQHADGSTADLSNTLKSLTASLSTKLGVRTDASVGLRRTEFESSLQPYTENALYGSIQRRF